MHIFYFVCSYEAQMYSFELDTFIFPQLLLYMQIALLSDSIPGNRENTRVQIDELYQLQITAEHHSLWDNLIVTLDYKISYFSELQLRYWQKVSCSMNTNQAVDTICAQSIVLLFLLNNPQILRSRRNVLQESTNFLHYWQQNLFLHLVVINVSPKTISHTTIFRFNEDTRYAYLR